jgi:hypothetical protein
LKPSNREKRGLKRVEFPAVVKKDREEKSDLSSSSGLGTEKGRCKSTILREGD